MSKTPEEVVQYVLKNMGEHSTVAGRVVRDLRTAGLLRDEPSAEPCKIVYAHCSEDIELIATLTRERDEARQLIDGYRKVAERYEASAASPEVMRVIDALLVDMAARPGAWDVHYHRLTTWTALRDAAHALAASRQSKAREPRYEVEHFHDAWFVWDRQPGWNGSSRVAAFYCANSKERAAAECARLNANGAK